MSRAASNIGEDHLELRSTLMRHAVTEHRDFRLLEADFVAAGGALEVANAAEMARAVVAAQDPAFRAPYLAGAARVQAENQHPLEVSLKAMEGLLSQSRPGGA